MVLTGRQIAPNSSDVIESTLICSAAKATRRRLDRLVVSLNRAWSLVIVFSLTRRAELNVVWFKLYVLRNLTQLIGNVLVVSLAG